MPRDGSPLRQRVQSVTDLAGVTREASEGGDLPIRSDATLGDPADDGIDALVAVRAHGKSGAPLHAAGNENDTSDDGQAASPGWYGMLFFDRSLEITDPEHLVLGLVAHAPEQDEGSESQKENPYQCERSHNRLRS
jgi:hypothetical protein